MIKHYCDFCGEEITEKNRLQKVLNKLTDGLWAEKHGLGSGMLLQVEVVPILFGGAKVVCKNCVLDALYKLDDRKKVSHDPR